MNNVVFQGIHIGTGGTGVPVFAECPNCGPTIALAPGMPGRIVLQDVLLECQGCGAGAEPVPGKYTFEVSVFPMLAAARLTRQQARRFLHKVEKTKSLDSLAENSAQINPALANAVNAAKKDSDPLSALRKICRIVSFLGSLSYKAVGGLGVATGAYVGWHEAWDIYQNSSYASEPLHTPSGSDATHDFAESEPRPKRKPDLKPSGTQSGEQKVD
ncbi:MAG: hypothetical protein MEQ74_12100 [Paracoccus sp.]|nr:hypothetical protein [Paracoccus sp. (in: a-proteobacteria)]